MTDQGVSHIDPTTEQYKAFAALPDEGPIWMLNLIRLKATASYGDGKGPGSGPGSGPSSGEQVSGASAYKTYGKESAPFFAGVGGKIILSGAPLATLIGPADEAWDLAFIAEYPNAAAFHEMVKNPGYQAIVYHRQAAVADSRLIRLKPGAEGKLFG